MDNGDAHPMNIDDDESDDSIEEIGKLTQSEGVASTSRPKKRKRKLISPVWDYFALIDQDPNKPDVPLVCKSKKCNKIYSTESYSGTGNLKRHLKICLKSTTRDIGQYMISSNKGVIGARNSNFNQGKFRELLVHALVKELQSPDAYMRKIADQMYTKFKKYLADFNLLLAVAVVFDPRYKYSFLGFSYAKLYGVDLFDKTESSSSTKKQGELDFYLDEPRAETMSSICVLDFWKSQQYRYPVLAKMAMDILCIPVSTVASESPFSLGGRILDQYRSSMKHPTVEALICTRDWLFSEKAVSHGELEEVQMVATRRNGEGDGPDFEAMINAALANALPNLSTELRTQIYNDIRNGAAEDWITHMEMVFKVLGCPDNFKTRLAAFKLEGDALSWWTAHLRTQAGGEAYADTCTWATFREIFYNRYFPVSEQQRFEREYGSIYQLERENSVEYMQRFMRLVSFVGPVAGDALRQARHFKWGLKRWVLEGIVNTEYPDVAQVCAAARNIELLHESGPSNKRDRDGSRIQHRGQGNQEYRGRSDQVQEYRGRSDQGQSYRGQHDRRQEQKGHDYRASNRSGNDRQGYQGNNNRQWKDQPSKGTQQNRSSGLATQQRPTEVLPPPPLCPTCGKPHPGPCRKLTGECYRCGSNTHRVKDCPKGNPSAHASTPRLPAPSGRVFTTTRDKAAGTSALYSKYPGFPMSVSVVGYMADIIALRESPSKLTSTSAGKSISNSPSFSGPILPSPTFNNQSTKSFISFKSFSFADFHCMLVVNLRTLEYSQIFE
ncbi:hypothetical protein CTI12_AA291960 [Artemisia annua]|uniref:CCHC-type domain-containing protein n=1 Tax=Artemisia annua TaxID=35608 RepID=A0A2U1N8U6_ARTAN|nr:hypothetical protein CTI12_AA291960 [Artemisia annua]